MWFNDIFDDFINKVITFKENKDNYSIKIAVPGYGKEDLEMNVDNGILKIKSLDNTLIKMYRIPEDIYTPGIEATCEKGLLKIEIPKRRQNLKAIEIK